MNIEKARQLDEQVLYRLQVSKVRTLHAKYMANELESYYDAIKNSIYRLRRNGVVIPNRGGFNGPYYLGFRVDIPLEWLIEDEAHRKGFRNTINYNTDLQSVGIHSIVIKREALLSPIEQEKLNDIKARWKFTG